MELYMVTTSDQGDVPAIYVFNTLQKAIDVKKKIQTAYRGESVGIRRWVSGWDEEVELVEIDRYGEL